MSYERQSQVAGSLSLLFHCSLASLLYGVEVPHLSLISITIGMGRAQKPSNPGNGNDLAKQFCQSPDVIGNPRFHRRGDSQRLVNPAEIVVRKIQ